MVQTCGAEGGHNLLSVWDGIDWVVQTCGAEGGYNLLSVWDGVDWVVQTCGAEGGCNLLNVDGMVLIGWFKHVGQKEGIIC